jgi:hypothetical protein
VTLRQQTNHQSRRIPNIRLTDRDIQILETIHVFDGLMSLCQIDRLYFSGQGRSQPRHRLRLLTKHGYLQQPIQSRLHQVPWGQTIYWLGRKGAEIIAALHSQNLKHFRWRNSPRYSQIAHDLAVNNFRICVLEATEAEPTLSLREWQPEGEFLAQPDSVEYTLPNGKRRKRQVRPDGYFVIEQQSHQSPFAFLLEIDRGTEDNPRFGREKILPSIAYLKSQAYQDRFGLRFGRFLIVTTGERRLQNMKAQAERLGGKGLFYFTTFDRINPTTIFQRPIWWLAGETKPRLIIPVVGRLPNGL